MDFDHEYVAAAVVVAVLNKKSKRLRQKRERSVWVKPWLSIRNELRADRTLLREFRVEDDEHYNKFLRMSPENFKELLRLVQFDIQKQDTLLREAIPASIKLAATIRLLSTGNPCHGGEEKWHPRGFFFFDRFMKSSVSSIHCVLAATFASIDHSQELQ